MTFPPDPDRPMSVHQFLAKLLRRDELPESSHLQRFRRLDDYTVIYEDNRDVIIVAIRTGIVLIVSGGEGAIPHWKATAIHEGPDSFFWEGVYQDVLACF